MSHIQLDQFDDRAPSEEITKTGPMMFWYQTEETFYDVYRDRRRELKNRAKLAIDLE